MCWLPCGTPLLPENPQTAMCKVAVYGKDIIDPAKSLPLPPNVLAALGTLNGPRRDWLRSMAVEPERR